MKALNENQCRCPTKKPKKGKKLDIQLFPDCKGTKYDRNIVKKQKKSFNLKEYKESKRQEG